MSRLRAAGDTIADEDLTPDARPRHPERDLPFPLGQRGGSVLREIRYRGFFARAAAGPAPSSASARAATSTRVFAWMRLEGQKARNLTDHNLAEAVLLAEFGRRKHQGLDLNVPQGLRRGSRPRRARLLTAPRRQELATPARTTRHRDPPKPPRRRPHRRRSPASKPRTLTPARSPPASPRRPARSSPAPSQGPPDQPPRARRAPRAPRPLPPSTPRRAPAEATARLRPRLGARPPPSNPAELLPVGGGLPELARRRRERSGPLELPPATTSYPRLAAHRGQAPERTSRYPVASAADARPPPHGQDLTHDRPPRPGPAPISGAPTLVHPSPGPPQHAPRPQVMSSAIAAVAAAPVTSRSATVAAR